MDMGHQLPVQWKEYLGKENGNTSYKTENQSFLQLFKFLSAHFLFLFGLYDLRFLFQGFFLYVSRDITLTENTLMFKGCWSV